MNRLSGEDDRSCCGKPHRTRASFLELSIVRIGYLKRPLLRVKDDYESESIYYGWGQARARRAALHRPATFFQRRLFLRTSQKGKRTRLGFESSSVSLSLSLSRAGIELLLCFCAGAGALRGFKSRGPASSRELAQTRGSRVSQAQISPITHTHTHTVHAGGTRARPTLRWRSSCTRRP